MPFPDDFYQYLRVNTLVGIKVGPNREDFVDIWVVEVNQRVFARSYYKNKRSWFTELLKGEKAKIQYGDKEIEAIGKRLTNAPELSKQINEEYLRKYSQPKNIEYAVRFSDPEYQNYTIEFLPNKP